MLNLKKLQTSTALALTLGVTVTGAAPIVFAKDAIAAPMQIAQLFPSSRPASKLWAYHWSRPHSCWNNDSTGLPR